MPNSDRVLRTQISGVKAVFDVHLAHLEKALILRTEELNKRLEGMNEFQKRMDADRARFVDNDILEIRLQAMAKCGENAEKNMLMFKEIYQEAHARLANRVTIIETRLITWTAAIAAIFILAQLALKYIH
jgi:hypothetical protein